MALSRLVLVRETKKMIERPGGQPPNFGIFTKRQQTTVSRNVAEQMQSPAVKRLIKRLRFGGPPAHRAQAQELKINGLVAFFE